MAITSEPLMDVLKAYYAKEGVANLLWKNSPVLNTIEQVPVAGATAEFAVNYGRSAAVGSNLNVVEANLLKSGRVGSFKVTPANLFAGAIFGEKELLASQEQRGAYLPIAELKMWQSTEGYRRTIAQAFYGDGTGYICNVPSTTADGSSFTSLADNAEATFKFEWYQVSYIDEGTQLVFKASKEAAEVATAKFEVTGISGQEVTIKNLSGATYTKGTNDVICLAGSVSSDGEKLAPVGLAGWLPKTLETGKFFGLDRHKNRDRLAGTSVVALSGEKKYETLSRAILAVGRYQSKNDLIIMNDIDAYEMAKEIESLTYFTKANGGNGKTKAQVGYSDFGFSVNDNFLDRIIKDPYCPKGTAYVVDSSAIEMWTFNNVKKLLDESPETVKPQVVASDGDKPTRPFQMLVDNIFTVKDGQATQDGNCSIVEISTFLNFVVTRPAACAVVTF